MAAAIWRPMAAADLDAVEAIAAAVHPAYPERREIPAERLRLHPAGCLVLAGDGGIAGYVVSHPWRALDPPKLDTLLGALPAARGKGAASTVVERLVRVGREAGLPTLSLVAVNRSAPFWERHGFVAVRDPALEAALASYDDDARFMVRAL